MPGTPSDFDESKHPRGQPDNPGKFTRRPIPEPPPPGRRPRGRARATNNRESASAEDQDAALLSSLGEHLSRLTVGAWEAHFALARSPEHPGDGARREALVGEAAARAETATAAWARLREIDALPPQERTDALEKLVEELERSVAAPATAEAAPSTEHPDA